MEYLPLCFIAYLAVAGFTKEWKTGEPAGPWDALTYWPLLAWERLWDARWWVGEDNHHLSLEARETAADEALYDADPELAVELGYHVPSCTCEACGGPKPLVNPLSSD